MKLVRLVELIGKYAKCPECGSETGGQGEGALHAYGDTFIRTCKCGWEVKIIEPRNSEKKGGAMFNAMAPFTLGDDASAEGDKCFGKR